MSANLVAASPYQDQLTRWTRSLAGNRAEDMNDSLSPESASWHVQLFLASVQRKRLELLRGQLGFLADDLNDFGGLLEAYTAAYLPAAYESMTDDGERFLQWLEQSRRLNAEDRDRISCQRAFHELERLARSRRLAHVRFQEMRSLANELAKELDSNPSLHLHLNPVHTWAHLTTPVMLEGEAEPPADVLFAAVGGSFCSSVVEAEGRALIEELSDWGPLTLDEWASRSTVANREDLAACCLDLAELGFVAFG